MTTCRFCAEEIQDEATVCKHCGRTLTPTVRLGNIVFGVVAILVALGILAMWTSRTTTPAVGVVGSSAVPPVVTLNEYTQLETGMSYVEAVRIIGANGHELSRSELADTVTIMYGWQNHDASNMNAMFQNDALVTKAQFGLR